MRIKHTYNKQSTINKTQSVHMFGLRLLPCTHRTCINMYAKQLLFCFRYICLANIVVFVLRFVKSIRWTISYHTHIFLSFSLSLSLSISFSLSFCPSSSIHISISAFLFLSLQYWFHQSQNAFTAHTRRIQNCSLFETIQCLHNFTIELCNYTPVWSTVNGSMAIACRLRVCNVMHVCNMYVCISHLMW